MRKPRKPKHTQAEVAHTGGAQTVAAQTDAAQMSGAQTGAVQTGAAQTGAAQPAGSGAGGTAAPGRADMAKGQVRTAPAPALAVSGGPRRGGPGIAPRRAALALIAAVLVDGRMLADLLADTGGPMAGLAPQDRARAQRMATQTLRNIGRADAVLAPLLRKAPSPGLRDLLRLGTVELLEAGEAAHGVVNVAVDLAHEAGAKAQPAFINAVLRRVAATPPDVWAGLPPQTLPGWLRARMVQAYGKPVVAAFEVAHAGPPPLDLTARDPGDRDALARALGALLLPTGSLRLTGPQRVRDLPGYVEGRWWVQDAAATLAVAVLAPQPGERVLDLCAAPGGKTMQLAAAGARVTALDVSASRLGRLSENLARTGLSAEIVVADALDWVPGASLPQPPVPGAPVPETWPAGYFDAVLLDAPCSATGTIRRHPDLPFARRPDLLSDLFVVQSRLIDRALSYLRPGGRLVFCTCSLLPEEGERQIAAALGRHPGLSVIPEACALPGIDPAWIGSAGGLRLRPDYWADRGGMDGFFVARLQFG